MFSPRCCATSSTRQMLLSRTLKVFMIGGNTSSKCTFTTTSMTWHTYLMVPVNSLVILLPQAFLPVEGGGRVGAAWDAVEEAYLATLLRIKPVGTGDDGVECAGMGMVRRREGERWIGGWRRGSDAWPWLVARGSDLGFR